MVVESLGSHVRIPLAKDILWDTQITRPGNALGLTHALHTIVAPSSGLTSFYV